MKHAAQTVNSAQLRQFAPLGKLTDDDAQELLRTSIITQLSPGTPLFKQSDKDKQLFYLLRGKVELRENNKKTIISAGTKEARKPMGHHLPGHISAKALEESVLVSIDADMLDLFLNWTNPNAYVVNEVGTSKDHEWMNRLLQSRGLLRFSETQINTLLERMNEVHFNAGETVISQDGDDEFYYIIKEGRANVSRKPDNQSKEIKLAELREGDAFGEESILTSSNRGATVTMQEAGNLMRLSKKDFSELLAEPLLDTISWDEAQAMAATGARFLDIRLEEEFSAVNIPGSINIPLPLLRLKLKHLNQKCKYVVCCNDGGRSSVAAFLLNRHGFDAYILDGGMATALPYLAIKQMPETGQGEAAPEHDPTTARDATTTVKTDRRSEAEVSPPNTVTVNQTEQGNEFCSLADYWGTSVDEASNDSFADSKALYNVEKTTNTPAPVFKPVATDTHKPTQKVTTKIKPPTNRTPAPVDNPYSESHLLRNSLIGITVIGLVAAFGMHKLLPQNPEPNQIVLSTAATDTPIRESNPSSPVEIAPVYSVEQTPLSVAETRQILTQAVQMDVMIEEADIFTPEAEMTELQADAIPAAAPPTKATIDPATRGFLQ